jgi:hypothetical protein
MKKFLLSLSLFAMAMATMGCSQQAKWNHKQKQAMRESLKEYRDMVYLEDLTDPEFVIFSDGVALEIEQAYPVYATLMALPGLNDTVEMFVVTEIVDQLDADAHNMRHIYPYRMLVSEGILPDKLTHEQQREFYRCFAQKVNNQYATVMQFVNAVLNDTTNDSQIAQFQQQCANDLFDWVVEIDEVVTEEPAPQN